jgi:signal transduction histidine kinase
MRKQMMMVAVAMALAVPGTTALAQESRATRADAEKMVKKGVEFLKKNGMEKAAAEMTAPSKTFVDRDLYLVIYDMNGVPVAHGQNPKQVGKPLIDLKDPDGKPFVRERVELAKSQVLAGLQVHRSPYQEGPPQADVLRALRRRGRLRRGLQGRSVSARECHGPH